MAQYTESVAVVDSYQKNIVTSEVVRAAGITASSKFTGGVGTSYPWIDASPAHGIVFICPPRTEKYKKKRITGGQLFAFVTGKSYYPTTQATPTSYPIYWTDDSVGTSFFRPYFDFHADEVASYCNLQRMQTGAFVPLTKAGWPVSSQNGTLCDVSVSVWAGVTDGTYANASINVSASISVQSHLGANKPYFIMTYEDVIPYVRNEYPQSGFVNEKVNNVFGWEFRYSTSGVGAPLKQASAKFRWRAKGATAYAEIAVAGAANTITIPANTFKTAQIEWQVVVVSDDGIASEPSAWYTLSTVDSVPGKPIPKSPVSVLRDGSEPIEMEWAHVVDTGSPQSKAELQYLTTAGEWKALATVTGPATKTTMPANTFPPGQIRWRVRTYNSDNVVGDWCDPVSFVSVRAPDAPAITSVSQSGRPVVTWQATGQIAYQVQIGEYDSGEVAGTEKTYKTPAYLPNGTYQIRLRVKGESSLWSGWAEAALVLDVTGPVAPVITADAVPGGAEVRLVGTSEGKAYLLRDNTPIADVTGLVSYRDNAALGEVVYTLRAVDGNDNYTDSAPVGVTVTVPYAMLAAVDNLTSPVPLKLTRGGPRQVSGSISDAVTYHHYAGRELPVATYGGQRSEAYQLDVALLRPYDRKRVLELIARRKTMLYRDNWGNRWYVTVAETGCEQDHIATSLSLSMTRVDYVEAINYAEV